MQLVYQYYDLSLSKNENMFKKTNQTKKTKAKRKKKKKVSSGWNWTRPLTYKVIAISIAPRHQTWNIHVKLTVFDSFCPWNSAGKRCVKLVEHYLWIIPLRDIFQEKKQGSDGKSCTLTHFVAFERPTKQNHPEVSCWRRCTAFTWEELRFSNNKHFCFYLTTKKHFISESCFLKNCEIGGLVVGQWENFNLF